MSVWWLSSSEDLVTINVADGGTTFQSKDLNATNTTTTEANNSIYCANSRATNVDFEFTSQRAASSITVSFSTASGSNWGIREYIFI